jgi:hypothetical protein
MFRTRFRPAWFLRAWCLRDWFLAGCLAAAFSAHAFGQTFVVPNANATVPGNSSFAAFSSPSYEVQEVFAPGQFPSGPIYITGVGFRAASGTGSVNGNFIANVYLSTARNYPNSTQGPLLSTTFADNLGADNTLMFSGGAGFDVFSACGAVCPFVNLFGFVTPFLYNPANGPLLLDLQASSASGTASLDSFQCSAPGCAVASINGSSPLGSPSGNFLDGGLIAQFTYMPAPVAGSPVTYYYTGKPFSQCDGGSPPLGAGPCPPSSLYKSDYEIASLTFGAPLAPNLSNANLAASPNLISWTIGDALGLVSFSSTDANASTELQDLSLSTDSTGSIASWTLGAQPAPFENGQPGNAYIYVQGPASFNQQGFLVADALSYDGGSEPGGAGYNLGNALAGTWSETLRNVQGGTTAAPVSLLSGSPVAQVSGTISGQGAQDYYTFYWGGGAFGATAYISGASSSASYLLTEGSAGACTGGASQTLSTHGPLSFLGTITVPSLPPGEYCIGIDANNSSEPPFLLNFSPPVSAIYPDAFFNGEQALSSMWSYLQLPDGNPFGYYAFLQGSPSTPNAWLFHDDLGYEYVVPGSASGSVYFYDLASNHWWYTSSSLFPYLYDFTLNSWIYYFPNTANPGHYTTSPRYFSNLTTQQVLTM